MVSIRTANTDDIPALVRLINAAFVVERSVFDGDRIGAKETLDFSSEAAAFQSVVAPERWYQRC